MLLPTTFMFRFTISTISLFVSCRISLSLRLPQGTHCTGNVYGFLFLCSDNIMKTKTWVAGVRFHRYNALTITNNLSLISVRRRVILSCSESDPDLRKVSTTTSSSVHKEQHSVHTQFSSSIFQAISNIALSDLFTLVSFSSSSALAFTNSASSGICTKKK